MKKTWMLIGFALAAGIFLAGSIFGDIVINEVMPHAENNLSHEWVELYNNGTQSVSLTNWNISDGTANDSFSINISNNSYALIVDDDTLYNGSYGCNAVYTLLNNSNFSCFEVDTIGYRGLDDAAESAIIYDNSSNRISNFSWNYSLTSSKKSWSYNGSAWLNCTPTPGLANNCTAALACNASSVCGNYGLCSNGWKTRNCTNTSASCANTTYTQNTSCSEEIYIELEWDEADIVNGEDFLITVNAYNLEDEDYDVKVDIQNEDEDIISETYGDHGETADNWESSDNYVLEFISGDGDQDAEIKLRIDSDYDDFSGDATITAKIRKTGTTSPIIDEVDEDIEVLEAEADSGSASPSSPTTPKTANKNTSANPGSDAGTVTIGGGKASNKTSENETNSIIYKSPTEYIKEYAPYAFSIVCVGVIVLLLWNKL